MNVFTRFVQENLDRLYSSAYRYVRDATEAEDLVQEALTRAWAHAEVERSDPELRAWIYKVLVHLVVDRQRRHRVLPVVPTDPAALPDVDAAPPSEQTALRRLGRAQVRAAIDALPGQYRLPVMLADIDGFSYDEIADQLDLPVGTVTSRIHRGRLGLRHALWQLAAADGIQTDRVCREAAHLLSDYCRGQASASVAGFVEAHLADCVRCAEAERTEREILTVLRESACELTAPATLSAFARHLTGFEGNPVPEDSATR